MAGRPTAEYAIGSTTARAWLVHRHWSRRDELLSPRKLSVSRLAEGPTARSWMAPSRSAASRSHQRLQTTWSALDQSAQTTTVGSAGKAVGRATAASSFVLA